MSITRGNAENYELDATTISGRKMSIKIRPNGFYYIHVEGEGPKPAICEQNYTSIREVRRARDVYVQEHSAGLAKLEVIERNGGPKPRRQNAKSNSE